MESLQASVDAAPDKWSGVWYDEGRESVVVGIPDTQAASLPTLAPGVTSRVVKRSFRELTEIVNRVLDDRKEFGAQVNGAYVDVTNNRVVAVLGDTDDASRISLNRTFGDAIAVQKGSPGEDSSGTDRWKERYPYWGGSAYHQNGTVSSSGGCSTAFSIQRADLSKKFLLTAGHCTLSSIGNLTDAASLSSGTSWNNLLGTRTGYANSLCASSGSSCDQGGQKYGDVAVFRVSGVAGVIWNGAAARTTTSSAVNSTQTSLPANGSTVCTNGMNGGVCGFYVESNFGGFYNGLGQLRSPVVYTTNDTDCIIPGDSGGAVHLNTSTGLRASGAVSGRGYGDGPCGMIYTSISTANAFFSTVTVLS